MQEIIRKSARTGLIFAAIGAVVATAAPFIMGGLASAGLITVGAHATLTLANVVQSSVIFGLFGLLEPALQPLFSFVFGGDKPESPSAAEKGGEGKTINLTIQQTQHLETDLANTQFRKNLDTKRLSKDKAGSTRVP